jgi:hypothetical protein
MMENMYENDVLIIEEKKTPKPEKTPEEKYLEELLKKVNERIMHIGYIRSMKRYYIRGDKGKGRLCGTGAHIISKRLYARIICIFSVDELEFIVAHFGEENDEDIAFKMTDSMEQETCDRLNAKLNKLIPILIIHRSLEGSGFFD